MRRRSVRKFVGQRFRNVRHEEFATGQRFGGGDL